MSFDLLPYFVPSSQEIVNSEWGDSGRQNAVSKKRRRNQNFRIGELEELLPYQQRIVFGKPLDKLSILRLTTSFLKLHKFMRLLNCENYSQKHSVLVNLMEQAIDGFLMVIDSDGVILYASDNIKSFVALDARDVIGFSLHNFVLSQQDSYTLTKNLEPDGNELSQHRLFFIQLRNPLSPVPLMLQMMGYLKIRVSPCGTKNQSFLPRFKSQSSEQSSETSSEETRPLVLGLVAECRPMATSLSILEIDPPNLSFTVKMKLDFTMTNVDPRIKDVLGFDAKDVDGTSYKSFTYPAAVKHMMACQEFLLRTGFIESPAYKLMSASGEWVWVRSQGVTRYKKNKLSHIDATFKLVGGREGVGHKELVCGEKEQTKATTEIKIQHAQHPLPEEKQSCTGSCDSSVAQLTPSPSAVVYLARNTSTSPACPGSESTADQELEILPNDLFTPQQQKQRKLYSPDPLPSLSPQEWMERQRKLQQQIQRQRKLLQDLLMEQEIHQKMMPSQLALTDCVSTPSPSSVVHSGHFPTPSPSPHNHSLSPHTPFPLSSTGLPTVQTFQPLSPEVTNTVQSTPKCSTGNMSLLGSKEMETQPGGGHDELPLSPGTQKLLQQLI